MSVSRQHPMPFGSEIQNDGKVCFRLWAPQAKRVELCLSSENNRTLLALNPQTDGWFELTTSAANSGSRYRYLIDGKHLASDPGSRYQAEDVHGDSQVIDPKSWTWQDEAWSGRPWHETIIYELHVGCFTPAGTFLAAIEKLDHLQELGITAIELMPIADFPGQRNWGYDGVLPFAPDSRYGEPDDLKALVQAAHAKGIMIFLDVVYNHFGPEGNYLHQYAPEFFSDTHHTPWGKAFNFDGNHNHWVRKFFIHNALYWLEEYHFDGLRLDAVQCIQDDSQPHFLTELATRVRQHFGSKRHIHLILENDDNATHYLTPTTKQQTHQYNGQWNDDFHHALHVLLTGETWGYYQDYADAPIDYLMRCLGQGFGYQGESSAFRQNRQRGTSSSHLPATAFINFLQNHDHIGNRPFAERLVDLVPTQSLRAATALLILAPFPPMLFMGQEWGCQQPFHFFCDLETHLGKQVRRHRRRELSHIPGFKKSPARARTPDPTLCDSFQSSILEWPKASDNVAADWLEFHRHLLDIRHREILPRLAGISSLSSTETKRINEKAFQIQWRLGDGSHLKLLANFGINSITKPSLKPNSRILYTNANTAETLPAWSVVWTLTTTPQA